MLNKRHFSLLFLIFFLLPVILAACSGGESDEITEPTPTFMPVPGTQIGASEESSQSGESEDSSGEGKSILSEMGPTRTPEATATPGPITRQVSKFTAETGLEDITILGLSIEDWINIGLSILIGVIGYLIGTWLVRGLATWVIDRTSSEFGNNLVESIGSSVRWLIVLLALQLATNRLTLLSADLKILLGDVYFIVGWVLLLRISWRSIDLGVQQATKRLAEEGRDKELTKVIKLAEGTAKVLAVLFLIGILLAHFGFNLIAFVATVGIGGLAISLAAKDTLANAIGGLIILIDQPFRVGDRIEVPNLGIWADVVEIGLRTTKVLTRDNRIVIFPNGLLTTAEIVNYSYPDPSYRLQIDVGIAYGTDIETAKDVLKQAMHGVEGVMLEKPVNVLYNAMGDSAMIFRVRWWIETYKDKRRNLDLVHTALQGALDEAGIESPYPIQTRVLQFETEMSKQLFQGLGGQNQDLDQERRMQNDK